MSATIYYDGECPLCDKYSSMVRLRETVGAVDLVDVRCDESARERLSRLGFDLDAGMVLEHAGKIYGGAAAVRQIARLTKNGGIVNRLSSALLRHSPVVYILYPLMRAGRNALLLLLGRERIIPAAREEVALFTLFSHVWGVCAFLQLAYVYYYRSVLDVQPTAWLVGGLGVLLALRPRSPGLFSLLTLAMLVEALMQMPSSSNSTALKNYVLLALFISAVYCVLRGRGWGAFMIGFAPVARCLLLIMYVFGVFHKINTDFLNPEVSCALALWAMMPAPLNLIDHPWFSQLAIWGTLIIESAIFFGLLVKSARFYAVIAGVSFHGMLAMSGYGFYPTFSTLSISLHMLFVAPAAAERIINSQAWISSSAGRRARADVLLLVAWFLLLWAAILQGQSVLVGLAWIPWASWLLYLIIRHGRERPAEGTLGPAAFSRTIGVNLVAMAFFLSCISPYFGLKTAQSINMFANLRLEGGQSNHLLIPAEVQRFPYLQDVVQLVAVSGSEHLRYIKENSLYITYYDLLNHLERSPEAVVSFLRKSELKTSQSAATLHDEITDILHPRWFRNWMVFNPVDLGTPKRCWINQ
jgi:predicted DCC family thiol-disulfide oxidoreductase YuxK